MKNSIRKLVLPVLLTMVFGNAAAQDKGTPVRLLVGYAAGGALDSVARALADSLRVALQQPVVVDNKPGANQRLAVLDVKRSRPDGLTILIANNGPFTLFPHLYKKLDFDPVKDFTPIGRLAGMELCLSVGPKVPAKDMKELVAWVKANPAEAAYATSGPATMSQFVGLMLGKASGVDFRHVPYKGGSPALLDVASGQVPLSVETCLEPREMAKAGKVRILATTGRHRNPELPTVPTLRESGFDVVAEGYVGVYAPANLPPDVARKLTQAVAVSAKNPEVLRRITQAALIPNYGKPEELAAAQAGGLQMWAGPIKASGMTLD
ncbi:MAG: tripartite tricarboxylate transporter substrate-binding protein [Acidovorax sp.]